MTNRKKKLTMKHKNNILKAYHDIRRPTVKMRNSKMRLDMNALCHYKHY